MAKGQQKSNKEKRKPKQDKAKPAAQTATFGGMNAGGEQEGRPLGLRKVPFGRAARAREGGV